MNRNDTEFRDKVKERIRNLDEPTIKLIFDKYRRQFKDVRQCIDIRNAVVCEMCSAIKHSAGSRYLVFYAYEFVLRLIKHEGILASNIMFVSDTERECKMVLGIFGCESMVFDYSNFDANFTSIKTKFDVVIGNPPYQEPGKDGFYSRMTKSIYHKLVEKIIDAIDPEHFIFVIPARWYVGGHKSFRERMIADTHLRQIKDYEQEIDVFPGTAVGGGIMWFHRDKSYDGPCNFSGKTPDRTKRIGFNSKQYDLKKYGNIIIRYCQYHSILDKVLKKSKNFVSKHVESPWLFDTQKLLCLEHKVDENAILCHTHHKGKCYFDRNQIIKGIDHVLKYKVITKTCYSGGFWLNVIAKSWIINPNEICSATYIILFTHDDEQIAKNFMSYSHTKFFRFLTMLKRADQFLCKETFKFVPEMDCTKSWTNQELYEYFNLTIKEIKMIEEAIADYK